MNNTNNNTDKQYFELLNRILNKGNKKDDRTGTGTLSIFEHSMRFNMSEGFPLLTSKKMFTKGIIHELIWFLKGDTNIKYLIDNNVHIWDGDAYKNYKKRIHEQQEKDGIHGYTHLTKESFITRIKIDDDFAKKWGELGPIYGKQWRSWNNSEGKSIDQIEDLINDLKNNPDSRRLIVSTWTVAEIDKMTLPPCHYGFQCYTRELNSLERWTLCKNEIDIEDPHLCSKLDKLNIPTRALSLKWIQRSVDTFLGLPFNIASYALLLELLAKEVNMIADELIFSGGDVHLYINHIEQANDQLNRETFELPKLILKNISLNDLKFEDIEIIYYKSAGVLKGELSN